MFWVYTLFLQARGKALILNVVTNCIFSQLKPIDFLTKIYKCLFSFEHKILVERGDFNMPYSSCMDKFTIGSKTSCSLRKNSRYPFINSPKKMPSLMCGGRPTHWTSNLLFTCSLKSHSHIGLFFWERSYTENMYRIWHSPHFLF